MSTEPKAMPEFNMRFLQEAIAFDVPGSEAEFAESLFPLPAEATHVSVLIKALEQLWLEDKLESDEAGFRLSWDAVYGLEPELRRALRLPEPIADLDVELRSTEYAGRPGFRIHARVTHPRYGLLPEDARNGPLFRLGAGPVLLSAHAWEIFRLLDAPPSEELTDQLLLIGSVRQAARYAGARLDAYLASQDILRPEGVAVEVEAQGPDRLLLRPAPSGIDPEEFPAFGREARPTRRAGAARS